MVLDLVLVICSVILGIVIGIFATTAAVFSTTFGGELKFQEDEDGVYPYVEGVKPLSDIRKRQFVLFRIAQE